MQKHILPGIGSIAFTFILWWLQTIPDPTVEGFINESIFSDKFVNMVWANRLIIGGVIAAIVAILTIINNILWYERPRKKWLREFLRHIVKEEFAGEFGNTRITVFETKSGWYLWLPYMFKVLIKYFRSHKKNKLLGIHFNNAPSLNKSHLVIYSRCSRPNENGSSTFFEIPNNNSEVFGIAAKCMITESCNIAETAYVSNIGIASRPFSTILNAEKTKLAKYAKDNSMIINTSDFNEFIYNKMRCIHRLSNHLYAQPIIGQNDNIWGILVIDVDINEEAKIFTTDRCRRISNAVDTISLSLSHIK